MLDLIKLKEYIDIPMVLEALGVETEYKSQRIWMLCPFHDDHKIGSAYFKKNGCFVCHACGTVADIFDVTMAVMHYTFTEAANFIAETCGGIDRFAVKEDDATAIAVKDYRNCKLSFGEMQALHIPKAVNLRALYIYDKDLYKQIVMSKAEKMHGIYHEALRELCQRDGKEAVKVYELFGNQTAASTYVSLANEVRKRIVMCEEILERLA